MKLQQEQKKKKKAQWESLHLYAYLYGAVSLTAQICSDDAFILLRYAPRTPFP